MLIERRDEADQVVIHARQSARMIDGVFQNNFVLVAADAGVTSRTVDRDGVMHAAEQLVGMELDGEADA